MVDQEAHVGLPILDLSDANDPVKHTALLDQLHDALFNIGFLYIKNHGVAEETISNLASLLPVLFEQPPEAKASLSKLNSPHFLGYSGYAEETTLGEKDLREQFDLATELPVVWSPSANSTSQDRESKSKRDFSKLYWRLRGPNQWPSEGNVPGFRKAYTEYHDALQELSYRFVHLIEEAFGIPVGTFDAFFPSPKSVDAAGHKYVPPQHRIKLVKYPPSPSSGGDEHDQGVGAHKDSSGWLTLLYQVGQEEGLEVHVNGEWISAPPIDGTFVVNFGNAFEVATEGAVKATVHRVKAPMSISNARYSIPFFQGLPLDLTVSEIRSCIPESVRKLRRSVKLGPSESVSTFLDPRWDSLGESQLRKWIRSHEDVGRKWYGDDVSKFYLE
ncbi:Clavaminate synthase-like protein [Zopfia rhizophila CBS 207.26]|uniref:Clavaminate synthase-like protein n=1 Tax=Zopfia rhizophila CBS 207.26 TaxID=1314779 RepID=A0A6A6DP23_9PEZI|nr:Clavaminate synthase-like protein [Zopfia rhizophila CBS 207.26]